MNRDNEHCANCGSEITNEVFCESCGREHNCPNTSSRGKSTLNCTLPNGHKGHCKFESQPGEFVKELESRSMSTWSPGELARYSFLTGQMICSRCPDQAKWEIVTRHFGLEYVCGACFEVLSSDIQSSGAEYNSSTDVIGMSLSEGARQGSAPDTKKAKP